MNQPIKADKIVIEYLEKLAVQYLDDARALIGSEDHIGAIELVDRANEILSAIETIKEVEASK